MTIAEAAGDVLSSVISNIYPISYFLKYVLAALRCTRRGVVLAIFLKSKTHQVIFPHKFSLPISMQILKIISRAKSELFQYVYQKHHMYEKINFMKDQHKTQHKSDVLVHCNLHVKSPNR